MKVWLLKLHRWVALVFALPLVFVLGTGLILAFEPWLVVRAIENGACSLKPCATRGGFDNTPPPEAIEALRGLATPLKEGDEVAIIPALAGGR